MTASQDAPAAVDGGVGRTAWRQASSAGSGMMAFGFVLITTLAGEVIPPVVVMAVLFAALAVLLRKVSTPWPVYAGIALPVLAMVGNAPFVVADIGHPESAAGFVPMALVLFAALFTSVSSAIARFGPSIAVRPVATATVGLGVLAVAGSVAMTASLDDDERRDGDVGVLASNVEYPAELRVPEGEVGFYIENDDVLRHTFLIEGTSVEQEVPGSTARRVSADLEPGAYRYYCDVPGHEDMEGTLVVE